MVKKTRVLAVCVFVGFIGVTFVSCFMFPYAGLNGEWEVKGGSIEYSEPDGYKETWDLTDGELIIEDQTFSMKVEMDLDEYPGVTRSMEGDGIVLVNTKNDILTLSFDNLETNVYDGGDLLDSDEEEATSTTYSYEVKGKELTLTREYSQKNGAVWDQVEEIELER
jgi:hypothetical protein